MEGPQASLRGRATRIRRIAPEDGPELCDLRLRALREDPQAFATSYEREAGRPAEAWTDWATRASAGPNECLYVAEARRRLVGLAGAFTPVGDPRSRHLIAMWVAPEARSGGIGQELTHAVVAWAAGTGAVDVTLWVVEGNETARRVYERAGFSMTGTQQPVPSNPSLLEALMRRTL